MLLWSDLDGAGDAGGESAPFGGDARNEQYGRAYGHAVRFGMGIDKGIGFARRAYGIMSPVMKELGINTAGYPSTAGYP